MANTLGRLVRPFTSIIVPTLRKRPDSLQRLLDSIDKYTHNYEILYAEGGDCYSASMNNALRKAKGDYLTIPGIADDIEVTQGWLSNMIEFMQKNPDVGMGAFKVSHPFGGVESYGGFITPVERFNTDPNGEPQYCGYGLVSRECFEKVGLMDENFKPIYLEDTDYGLRVWQAGYKVKVCPEANIIHHHEQEGREMNTGKNKEYLWKKHNL
ncbi:MAG: Glycosyl transferase family 2 [Deltaproteobacteria bacterium ADurb.Bin135]|nr:MAG: Glycosyl transferase family 2 [Deltaproteobacteria bacterium ADurb.Bin135]